MQEVKTPDEWAVPTRLKGGGIGTVLMDVDT